MANFRWLVQIEGDARQLSYLPGLLTGPEFHLTTAPDGRLFLGAAVFEACTTPDEVTEVASRVLRQLASVLQIYAWAPGDFKANNVFWKDESGHLEQCIKASIDLRIISSQGLKDLARATTNASTLGADLLWLASTDDRVARAFDLLAGKEIGWYELYDLIDIMGGVASIVRQCWAVRGDISDIRQTANHYRHRGLPSNYPPPANPPSLKQARTTITNIFRQWLSQRFGNSSKRGIAA